MFVRGSAYIDAKLAQGWTIVENDYRNHLTRDVSQGSTACDNDAPKSEPVKVEQTEQQRRRPRIGDRQ